MLVAVGPFPPFAGDWSFDARGTLVGDFNGDGKDDYARVGPTYIRFFIRCALLYSMRAEYIMLMIVCSLDIAVRAMVTTSSPCTHSPPAGTSVRMRTAGPR